MAVFNIRQQITQLSFRAFAGRCVLCQASSALKFDLCAACFTLLRRQEHQCSHCGLNISAFSGVCGQCLQHPPAFDRVISGCDYHWLSAPLVKRFKQHRDLTALRVLNQLLYEEIQRAYRHCQQPRLIIPMPLHWRRLWWRGFNQSQWIADSLAGQLSLRVDSQSVKRRRATSVQHHLNRRQRLKNLQGAFELSNNLSEHRHIAIVDDVITTGSTCHALASLLKHHGISQVDCWSLTRTPTPQEKQ